MGWRDKMGGSGSKKAAFKTPTQNPQNTHNDQKDERGGVSAYSAYSAGKIENVKSYPIPKARLIPCHVKSAILGRTVKMVLDSNTPDEVVFDGARYSVDEINKLKTLDRENLIAAHNFQGGTPVNCSPSAGNMGSNQNSRTTGESYRMFLFPSRGPYAITNTPQ